MNSKKIILAINIFMLIPIISSAQLHSIKGKVLTREGKPAAYVNLSIDEIHKHAMTDSLGIYEFKNIAPGTYHITITHTGLETKKIDVIVSDGNETRVDLIYLRENSAQLNEVIVYGKWIKKYKDSASSIAMRSDIKLIETPQAVQVITKDVMKDQQTLTLNEVLKNATGVSNSTPYSDYSIRGFTSYNTMMYNGVDGSLFPYNIEAPLFNVQEMEILRGPAAILYGTANPGGLVNLITKKPLNYERFEANIIYGSWNEKSLQIDQTNSLSRNKKLAYRILVNASDNGSFRKRKKTQQLFITPSLSYKFSDNTTLNFEYNYFNVNTKGSGWDDGTLVRQKPDGSWDWKNMPVDFSVQSPSDKTLDYGHTFDLSFKHQFNKNIGINFLNRYLYNYEKDRTHYYDNADPAYTNDTINRWFQTYDFATIQYQSDLFATFKFSTGKIKNKLTIGADYTRQGVPRYVNKGVPASPININTPDYSADNSSPDQNFQQITNNFSNIYSSIAFYIQEQAEISKYLKVSAGLRYDSYSQKSHSDFVDYSYDSTIYPSADTIKSHAWVPRFGVVFNPKENIALYANYTESFEPQSVNAIAQGGPFPPLTGKSFEIGFKADMFKNNLSATVDYFNTAYRNMLVPDLSDSTGQRYQAINGFYSKGIEATAHGNITPGLSVILNYSYDKVAYSDSSAAWSKNDRQINVPKNIYGLFLNYSLLKRKINRLNLNVGFHHESNRVASYSNQLYVAPGYSVLDAGISYGIKNYTVYFKLNNITNTRYATGGHSSGLAYAGQPRSFRITLNYIL
ncbi:MAG TPA: TonB-dependent receptor [Puia sp.]|nr:TonB-dependent receptor [Puia sp.]